MVHLYARSKYADTLRDLSRRLDDIALRRGPHDRHRRRDHLGRRRPPEPAGAHQPGAHRPLGRGAASSWTRPAARRRAVGDARGVHRLRQLLLPHTRDPPAGAGLRPGRRAAHRRVRCRRGDPGGGVRRGRQCGRARLDGPGLPVRRAACAPPCTRSSPRRAAPSTCRRTSTDRRPGQADAPSKQEASACGATLWSGHDDAGDRTHRHLARRHAGGRRDRWLPRTADRRLRRRAPAQPPRPCRRRGAGLSRGRGARARSRPARAGGVLGARRRGS